MAEEPSFLDKLLGRTPTPDPAIQTPDAVPYTVSFVVSPDDRALTAAAHGGSLLESLLKEPPSGGLGLVRRASLEEDRIAKALSALGYYEAVVHVDIAGVPSNSPDAARVAERARAAGPVPVTVKVEAGPQFTFGSIAFKDQRTGAPIAAEIDRKALDIDAGDPARTASVFAAERAIVDLYRSKGYPFATVPSRDALADHTTHTLNITFVVKPGPYAVFGPVTVTGTQNMKPSFIYDRVPFEPGDPYSPDPLARFRKDISKYEAFESVRVREGDALDAKGGLPVMVEVKERLPRFVGFGAKYSTTDGPAANAYWGHRNLFGGAEQLRIDAQVSRNADAEKALGPQSSFAEQLGYKVGATFTKPGIITVQDDLVAQAAALRETTKIYQRDAGTLAVGIKRRFNDQLSAQIGIDVERARIRDVFSAIPGRTALGPEGYYTLVGLPLEVTYDSTNKPLDPSSGFKASATVEPFPSFLGSTVDMTLIKGSVSGYFAFDDDGRYILAARVAAGSIAGASLEEVPLPRRFFAGGGGSVRGYDFQGIGPRDPFNRVIGGRSLLEGSLEARIKVTDTIGIVPFVDAGGTFRSSYPDFDDSLRYAAGLGLRYYTAIGPIRVDIARGLNRTRNDPLYGIYISLGQSF